MRFLRITKTSFAAIAKSSGAFARQQSTLFRPKKFPSENRDLTAHLRGFI
jgi:hypothetical protein